MAKRDPSETLPNPPPTDAKTQASIDRHMRDSKMNREYLARRAEDTKRRNP